jgi:hypothetical protein
MYGCLDAQDRKAAEFLCLRRKPKSEREREKKSLEYKSSILILACKRLTIPRCSSKDRSIRDIYVFFSSPFSFHHLFFSCLHFVVQCLSLLYASVSGVFIFDFAFQSFPIRFFFFVSIIKISPRLRNFPSFIDGSLLSTKIKRKEISHYCNYILTMSNKCGPTLYRTYTG